MRGILIGVALCAALAGCRDDAAPAEPSRTAMTSTTTAATATVATTTPPSPTHNPHYKQSAIAGVDMTLGAKLTYQKPGLEVWETLDTQQQTLNHFYASGTVLPFCRGKFTSTGKDASYGLFYGTAQDGIEVIVNDYSVWISRGTDPEFPATCS